MSMSKVRWHFVFVAACGAAALSGCHHADDNSSISLSSSVSPYVQPSDDAAFVVLSLDQMRRLTAIDGLELMSELDAFPHQGGYDQEVPVACRAVDYMDVAFGNTQTLNTFKALDFASGTQDNLMEAVAIYRDDQGADQVFNNLATQLDKCADLHADHYEFHVDHRDPSSFALCYEQCRTLYQRKGQMVVTVAANNFQNSQETASKVMQAILHRVG